MDAKKSRLRREAESSQRSRGTTAMQILTRLLAFFLRATENDNNHRGAERQFGGATAEGDKGKRETMWILVDRDPFGFVE